VWMRGDNAENRVRFNSQATNSAELLRVYLIITIFAKTRCPATSVPVRSPKNNNASAYLCLCDVCIRELCRVSRNDPCSPSCLGRAPPPTQINTYCKHAACTEQGWSC